MGNDLDGRLERTGVTNGWAVSLPCHSRTLLSGIQTWATIWMPA